MTWVWIALLVLLAPWILWIALFFSGRMLCPSCGIELPDDFAYPGQKVGYCPSCGWRRE